MADQGELKDILLRVQAGERNFAPALPSPEAVAHFQPIARHLKTALDQGLIEQAHFMVSKRRETYNSIVSVAIDGGLTIKGVSWLASPPAKEPSAFRQWLVNHTSAMIFTILGGIVTAIILIAWDIK